MPPGFLRISYVPDLTAGYSRVSVVAEANGFAGRSTAWMAPESLTAFAGALTRYPFDTAEPPTLAAGFGANARTGEPPLDQLRIVAQPVGPYGQVAFVVALSDRLSEAPRPRHAVNLELLTTYERVRRFSADVAAIAIGEKPEAHIDEETLAK